MRLCSFLVLALLPAIAQAAPESFVHNGRVLDAFGGPLQGEHTLGFSAHAGPGTSDNLWDESETVVLADGYYSVVLGDETPFPGTLWDGAVRWLQVAVDGDVLGPRSPVHGMPYALVAGRSDTSGHANTAGRAETAVRADSAGLADSAINATGDITPDSVDVSDVLRARSGVLLHEVTQACPAGVAVGTVDYQASTSLVRVCTPSGWSALNAGLTCPAGWWRVNDGKLCVEMALQPAVLIHAAIKECRDNHGARVCTHNDLQLACGYNINPYAGAVTGWYGDHARFETSGNTDDEYLTWNRNTCDASGNNDGPAGDSLLTNAYRCCR
ncbi:MAG: hypothetical protein ACJATT_004279 [Myxococcota bacterium]|jgi:hypothetical protein